MRPPWGCTKQLQNVAQVSRNNGVKFCASVLCTNMAAVMLHESWEYRLLLGKERHGRTEKNEKKKKTISHYAVRM